ncbi:MAG: DNA-processing protein DprA [Oligoflexia bacterium]|nr:DNA-processing protein DprA [Oligoflexia bacterium]
MFYYKGHLDLLQTRCIAIVGSRKASENGMKRAEKLSRELAQEGFTIVSGLAKGIDVTAHQSAIKNDGKNNWGYRNAYQ